MGFLYVLGMYPSTAQQACECGWPVPTFEFLKSFIGCIVKGLKIVNSAYVKSPWHFTKQSNAAWSRDEVDKYSGKMSATTEKTNNNFWLR